MKIAIGYAEIAGVLKDYTIAFEKKGLRVTSINTEPNRFYTFKYTIDYSTPLSFIYDKQKITNPKLFRFFHLAEWLIKRIIGFFVFFKLLFSHDVFLYQWTVLFNQKFEYKLIKLFNKKIITVFLGSDVRHISAFQQEFKGNQEKWEQIFHNDNLNKKIRTLRVAELYSDLILSVPDQAGLAIRPYNHLQLIMETDTINRFPKNNKIPYIVHAPSKKGIKGTDKIIAALNKLETEGILFNFRLLHNIPNNEVIEELKRADIVVDEIYLNGPGKLGLEAMAYGCALATRHLVGASPRFAPVLCNINPENLYDQLKNLISDSNYCTELAISGNKYVTFNNNSLKITDDILNAIVDQSSQSESDYIPYFFLQHYQLPDKVKISRSNLKLTAKVLKKWGVSSEIDLDKAYQKGLVPEGLKDQVLYW